MQLKILVIGALLDKTQLFVTPVLLCFKILIYYQKKVLSFIDSSDFGIPEDECLELFEVLNKQNINIDRLLWAQIIRSLSPVVKFTTNNNLKLVKLVHQRIRKVFYNFIRKNIINRFC